MPNRFDITEEKAGKDEDAETRRKSMIPAKPLEFVEPDLPHS
jgi:hypothetical protein